MKPVSPAAPSAEIAPLLIEFPQIGEGLPDVWGEGEPLRISIRLRRGSAQRASLLIQFDGKTKKLTSTAPGRWAITHTFKKGRYTIRARLKKDGRVLEGAREIKIVDYREEVVEIFSSALNTFRERGVDLKADFTPREVQAAVERGVPNINRAALDELVSVFELAKYSHHPITRKEYERAYRSFSFLQRG